jgi:hypothetical protein
MLYQTAAPKGVETTHRNLSHVSVKAMTLLMKLEPGVDKVIGVLPMFRECRSEGVSGLEEGWRVVLLIRSYLFGLGVAG